MTNRIPDYLKLHTEEAESAIPVPTEIERLCSALADSTGNQLKVTSHESRQQLTFPWSDSVSKNYVVTLTPSTKEFRLPKTAELESALTGVLNALSRNRHALRLREAELAATVPVVAVDEDGSHLFERIEGVLRGITEVLRGCAAGLYLLDEATTSLKLRAHYGLSPDVLTKPQRPLEECPADVEALAGHAVVIDDARHRTYWNAPESCAASICVPVASSTTILGTLWIFGRVARDFSPSEQTLAEIAAGRLAADLERTMLAQEVTRLRRAVRNHREMESWTDSVSEIVPPRTAGWDIAEAAQEGHCRDFCHWCVTDSSRLLVSLAAARNESCPHLSTASLRAFVSAHAQHSPGVREFVEHVNRSLWASSSEGGAASLFHGQLDPESGNLKYAICGNIFAYVLRPHGWEPLHRTCRQPVGTNEGICTEVLRQILLPGDVVIAISSPGTTRGLELEHASNQAAELLLHHTHLSAKSMAEMATVSLASIRPIGASALAALVMKRKDA